MNNIDRPKSEKWERNIEFEKISWYVYNLFVFKKYLDRNLQIVFRDIFFFWGIQFMYFKDF